MKNLYILIFILFSFNAVSQSYWRTLTFRNVSGFTVGGKYNNTLSMALSYELPKKFSIESWTGANYNWTYSNGWLSTQNSFNKTLKNDWLIGTGFMYGGGMQPGNVSYDVKNNDFTLIFVVQKRFKL